MVHRLFKSGGASVVIDWYTKGVDSLIVEMGLASNIANLINDDEWDQIEMVKKEGYISELIQKDLGITVIKNNTLS